MEEREREGERETETNLLDLDCKFSGGREDQSLRLSQLDVHLLQHGYGKGRRLARPRLGPLQEREREREIEREREREREVVGWLYRTLTEQSRLCQ